MLGLGIAALRFAPSIVRHAPKLAGLLKKIPGIGDDLAKGITAATKSGNAGKVVAFSEKHKTALNVAMYGNLAYGLVKKGPSLGAQPPPGTGVTAAEGPPLPADIQAQLASVKSANYTRG